MLYVWLALGAISLVLYISIKVKGCNLTAVFLKTVVSVFFIAVALCTAGMTKPVGAALTTGGLCVLRPCHFGQRCQALRGTGLQGGKSRSGGSVPENCPCGIGGLFKQGRGRLPRLI